MSEPRIPVGGDTVAGPVATGIVARGTRMVDRTALRSTQGAR